MKRLDVLRTPRTALAATVMVFGALAFTGSPERRTNPPANWESVQLGRDLFTHRWTTGEDRKSVV